MTNPEYNNVWEIATSDLIGMIKDYMGYGYHPTSLSADQLERCVAVHFRLLYSAKIHYKEFRTSDNMWIFVSNLPQITESRWTRFKQMVRGV